MSDFVYGVLFLSFVVMAIGAVGMFAWAAQNGQMKRLQAGSEEIFDAEETIGTVTDHFPDHKNFPVGKASFIAVKRKKIV